MTVAALGWPGGRDSWGGLSEASARRQGVDHGRWGDVLLALPFRDDHVLADDLGYGDLGCHDSDFFHSAGPLRGLKGSLYEGGIRVPMIARWPGKIAPGRTTDLPSAFWDVLPTLCDVAGIAPPAGIDGISFLPALVDRGEQKKHESLYWEFSCYGGQQAIRCGDWKAIRKGLQKHGGAAMELYNLADDVSESTDLAAQQPEVVARLVRRMAENHTPSAQFPFKALDKAQHP